MGGVDSSPVKQTSFILGRQTRERRPMETNKIEKGQRKAYRRVKRNEKKHGNQENGWAVKGERVGRNEEWTQENSWLFPPTLLSVSIDISLCSSNYRLEFVCC